MNDYTPFEKAVFRMFNTEEGQYVLSELEKKFVYTSIVQADGEFASAIRGGKSELVRFLRGIHNKIKE